MARTFGIPASELTERLTAAEFIEHWADYAANPWGETRADLRSGMIAALLYNINRGRNDPARNATDFLLYREEAPDETAVRQQFMKRQKKRRRPR